MEKLCLMIVFNHRYDQNIIKIKELYQNRFSNIYLLIPFYDGPAIEGLHIIPVYESSHKFQGYIATAYQYILKTGIRYKHYVIIGDDLILNPSINENSILTYLNIDLNDSYIKALTPINKANGVVARRLRDEILEPFIKYTGVEWKDKILPPQEAFMQYESKQGKKYPMKITWSWLNSQLRYYYRVLNKKFKILYCFYQIFCVFQCICLNRGFKLPYPLLKDYSDFLVINGDDMPSLCQMLGVFAAMDLFVEVAIPTAMALTCSSIKCEKDIDRIGVEYWREKDIQGIQLKFGCSLKRLYQDWDENVIYYHPIKLSRWN